MPVFKVLYKELGEAFVEADNIEEAEQKFVDWEGVEVNGSYNYLEIDSIEEVD